MKSRSVLLVLALLAIAFASTTTTSTTGVIVGDTGSLGSGGKPNPKREDSVYVRAI